MDPWTELLEMVRAAAELPAEIEPTGRLRGGWVEVIETVLGESDAYAYWVALDPGQPAGYRIVEHDDRDPDAFDLDVKHLLDNDGEA